MKEVRFLTEKHPVYGHLVTNEQIFEEPDYGSVRTCYEEGCLYAIRHMIDGILVHSILKAISKFYKKGYTITELDDLLDKSDKGDEYWLCRTGTLFEKADDICMFIESNVKPVAVVENDWIGKYDNAMEVKDEFINHFLRGYVTTCWKEYKRIEEVGEHSLM